MSDHKWDRFKRVFGAAPSDDLITVRDGKVTAALVDADLVIADITRAGLDAAALQTRRGQIELSRTQALALRSNTDKGTALDTAKDNARALVKDATTARDQLLGDLAGQLDIARKAIATPVRDAKALTQPLCKTAATAPLKTVEDAARDAEGRANDSLRLDALRLLDVGPLTALLVTAKQVDRTMRAVPVLCTAAQDNINQQPDGQTKTDFGLELKPITDELADLANEADLAELLRRAKGVGDSINELLPRIALETTRHVARQKKLVALRAKIAVVIDSATAVDIPICVTLLKGTLDATQLDITNAELATPDQAKIDALEKVDLKPLTLAVASVRDIDNGVPSLLEGLASGIGKLPDTNTKKAGFANEMLALNTKAGDLKPETDIETARKGYALLRTQCNALMDKVLKAGGQDGYEDALKARFGVDVTKNANAKVNLSGAYDMLNLVPESHVGHDKLIGLNFTASAEGGGAYGGGKIDMDNFGSGNDGYVYTVDGKTVKPNGFNVCMLHEIGHAVDDKYGIMDGLMGKAGYGSWIKESLDSVKTALLGAAETAMGVLDDPTKIIVGNTLGTALGGTEPKKPTELTAQQWKALQKYTGIAVAITEKKKPWFNAKPSGVAIGKRVYVESYGNDWHSYNLDEYASQNVRDYQWRAPGEWFADLYGILWMTKKPAPSGVGPALARWLPS